MQTTSVKHEVSRFLGSIYFPSLFTYFPPLLSFILHLVSCQHLVPKFPIMQLEKAVWTFSRVLVEACSLELLVQSSDLVSFFQRFFKFTFPDSALTLKPGAKVSVKLTETLIAGHSGTSRRQGCYTSEPDGLKQIRSTANASSIITDL